MLRLKTLCLSGVLLVAAGIAGCGTDSAESAGMMDEGASPTTSAPILSLGSLGMDPADEQPVFSTIVDVRGGSDGSFVVLDRMPSIRWFSQEGTYQGGIASSGAGPGELREPTSIFFAAPDVIGVGDPTNNRTSFYRLTQDSVYYERSFPSSPTHQSGERAGCAVSGRLFVRDLRDGYLIHELTQDGDVLRSFQPAESTPVEEFGPAAEMAGRLLNSGRLLCMEEPSLVLSVSRYLPYVRGYTLDGTLVWETELSNFRLYGFEPLPQGGISYEPDPEGSHIGMSAAQWNDDEVLIQYSIHPTLGTPEDRDFFKIDSRIISLSTGEELRRTETLPRVAEVAEGDSVYYSFDNLPFPRVHVFARDE